MVYIVGGVILWLASGYLAGFLFHWWNSSDWRDEDERKARLLILFGPVFLLALFVAYGVVMFAKWFVGRPFDEAEHSWFGKKK